MERYRDLLQKGEQNRKEYFEERQRFIEELERKHQEDQDRRRASRMSHRDDLIEQAQEKVSILLL